jgi:peptidoglycan/xylan/chitin deacetylase (PgdA/CDA1 family)
MQNKSKFHWASSISILLIFCSSFFSSPLIYAFDSTQIFAEDAFIVTSFGSKHPFKVSPGGKHNLRNRKEFYPGIGVTESVSMESAGKGMPIILKAHNIGPFDFSSSMIKLWFKVENIQNIKDLSIYVGNKNFSNFARFSLLGHQGQKWITEGDWVPLTFSWNASAVFRSQLQPGTTLEDLRKNITDIKISLIDDGKGVGKLHISRISAVTEPRAKYPKGVISITFDDNLVSQYTQAKPKLDQYHMPATAYIIVGFLDTPNYMSLEQVKELESSSNWEISCHAFDPVMHLKGYTHYSLEAIEKDILTARKWLWQKGFGFGSDGKHGLAHFAYPKGEFKQVDRSDVLSVARKHFVSARSINEKHREVWPPADRHKLRVLYITGPKSAEAIISEIENGKKAGEWIILVLHDLVEKHERNDQWDISKFTQLMDYIGTHQEETPVRTVGDVLSETSLE